MVENVEEIRLREAREVDVPWRAWGPYLSERQWGTVREDYSDNGDAWNFFTHDQSRSHAYRLGEDGIAGISDEKQRICFALAFWNGQDPILKERLFGLTNSEGNHGEDVKEYYFYLDNTPTHAYMKQLYKYPQAAYPYTDLIETNRRRTRSEPEYELIDTGVFYDDRYFDIVVEYAKAAPDDILIRITAHNRGPDPATLHLLPTLWFRNTWSWGESDTAAERPELRATGHATISARHADLGEWMLTCEGSPELLFTENETNAERLWNAANRTPYVKDAFHEYVVHGRSEAVNPERTGTKAAACYALPIDAGSEAAVRLRLTAGNGHEVDSLTHDAIIQGRRAEADVFYASVMPTGLDDDERLVMRQGLAGMLWTKQYYYFDPGQWLEDHHAHPLRNVGRSAVRNQHWFHMMNDDVISMPDKWEYPWYAAWDLAFHTIALATVDIDFAKQQLDLMLREFYLHPNGPIPAYEWNFGDVNPPVHAWATLFVYNLEQSRRGEGDLQFLKHAFNKLMINFTWWVNRKDPSGRNVFEGGFLGLDNIGVFDRSSPLPTGGYLEQADGTAWMALYCQMMLNIVIELARHDPDYGDLALKFIEHFLWIASAMDRIGERNDEMWDEEDGFFYDVLRFPDGGAMRLKVRSLVGLLPLCAVCVIDASALDAFPDVVARVRRFLEHNPDLTWNIAPPSRPGVEDRRLLAILDERKLRRVLARMLDENEFLSPYGIRSLSRHHLEHPYVFDFHGQEYRVAYLPAESDSGMFGGNSNRRGPIWFPTNLLLIRALLQLYLYYGDDFTVECPTGSGQQMTLFEVAREISTRLSRIFLRNEAGTRPVFGGVERLQTDPHWRDHLLFYEYFHGDNGAGIGASHQTGWTGLVVSLIALFGVTTPEAALASDPGRGGIFVPPEDSAGSDGRT